ncbi:cobalt/nickel transport system permease protein [Desulfacinum hydrothermale DSM 13146]|uniref:Cobalt/nickel transport system permease protein n=1 Tax=Desulfacinum hydrothermale DSM 13146 TaxID=1121390 RepID=A0A1W1XIW7_9BACT|nr:cobalt transporter CbiM [Desulfacinum hydrothermale]SMC23905.1 cobalt/nickel transport system permease protein [Desulfacinum hydrothermale DSM 13146]
MHISDGVLPTQVALTCFALSAGCVAVSLKKTHSEDLPKVAVMTSAFFVASLVHVPLGPTSVHLLLPGLVGIFLGWSSFLAIFLGLVLQCLLFQFGGLTALGANGLMMGLPAWLAAAVFHGFRDASSRTRLLAGAVVSGGGVVVAALILAVLLATGGEDFAGVAKLALAAHVPVVVLEAVITGFVLAFVDRVKPELLGRSPWRSEAR